MTAEPEGARILIIDDDPGIVRAIARILGRRHQVVTAASGEAALEEARACGRTWRSSISACRG